MDKKKGKPNFYRVPKKDDDGKEILDDRGRKVMVDVMTGVDEDADNFSTTTGFTNERRAHQDIWIALFGHTIHDAHYPSGHSLPKRWPMQLETSCGLPFSGTFVLPTWARTHVPVTIGCWLLVDGNSFNNIEFAPLSACIVMGAMQNAPCWAWESTLGVHPLHLCRSFHILILGHHIL
jgi:hypothetical protein